jgi:hypothetical protein
VPACYRAAVLFLSRLIIASTYSAAAFLFGMLLGERGELGFVQHLFTIVIPMATVVMTIVAAQGRIAVVATGLALLGGVLLGQQQFTRAFNDCNLRAPIVRNALLEHHARNGGYPARLEELPIALPCRAGLRKTILHYLSNDRGFRLWYSNDRSRSEATERVAFGTAVGRNRTRNTER